MAEGTIILNDFDKTRKTRNPAIIENIAVRVPDWNIPQVTSIPVIPKKYLSHFTLEVIDVTRNASAEPAALQP